MKNLKFRRQFLLINKSVNILENWKSYTIKRNQKDFYLYHHPDLEVINHKIEKGELILLGYILDPFNPEYDNSDILKYLGSLGKFEDMLKASENYNGRYIIIFSDSDSILLFNDATAGREIFYLNSESTIACGSTPNIIAEFTDIKRDGEKAINEFFNSPELRSILYTRGLNASTT